MWPALLDLVLPAECAGCGAGSRTPVCGTCAAVVSAVAPGPVAPDPVPPGFPPCAALGGYDGVLRELILAYKERGRHDLARPLGRLLAAVVSAGVSPGTPVALVPVPATAAAARQRYGDHVARLAGHAARALRTLGPAIVCRSLRAPPRPDSAGLDAPARARAAAGAFRVRPTGAARLRRVLAAGAQVIVVDDIVTTGATLTAIRGQLAAVGVIVHRAAVLAATERRFAPK